MADAGKRGASVGGVAGNVAGMSEAQRVEALATLAHDGDPRVRKSVAIALGRLGVPDATPALCELLADADEGVRVLACQALGRVADPASVPALLERVHDESVEVRSGVLFALASVVAHGSVSDEVRASLFTPMVVMAFDPDDGVRADAAATLGALRDGRAVEPLALLAEDACAQVRANACASLGLADEAAALPVLLERAEDGAEEPLVRIAALDGLARRAERGSLPAEVPEAVRVVALACALAEGADCGTGACGDGSPANGASDPSADAGVCTSDGMAADAVACEEETPTAKDLRATAVWALGLLPAGGARIEVQRALESALSCEDVWCQRYAIEALARIGDDAARAALRALDARRAAGDRALAPEAAEVLRQALALA